MRPTRKLSVCLVAVKVGLLLVVCKFAWAEEPQQGKPTIKELQQERLAILEKMREIAKKHFANGRVAYDEVLAAQREHFAARLEYAETKKDKIKVCFDAIQEAREGQKLAQAHVAGARGTALVVMKYEAYLLEAQIAREKLDVDK